MISINPYRARFPELDLLIEAGWHWSSSVAQKTKLIPKFDLPKPRAEEGKWHVRDSNKWRYLALIITINIFFFHFICSRSSSRNLSTSSVMHQSIPAIPSASPPPPGLLRGICPPCQSRVWGICKLYCPGAGHLPNPGLYSSFWHVRGFLSENNYTEDFTGKTSILAHLSRTGTNWRGL